MTARGVEATVALHTVPDPLSAQIRFQPKSAPSPLNEQQKDPSPGRPLSLRGTDSESLSSGGRHRRIDDSRSKVEGMKDRGDEEEEEEDPAAASSSGEQQQHRSSSTR